MNKNISILHGSMGIIVLMLFSFVEKPFEIKKGNYGEVGDTMSFAPNKGSGWDILSSYMNQDTQDSVQFEVIVKRAGRIDGKTDQLIGTITNKKFWPVKNQRVDYYLLLDNVWSIRITTQGECYLKQDRGPSLKPSALAGNPDVIPIQIRYKNN